MLIDFIDVEKLPYWLVWLDWCFYAYKAELVIFILGGALFWVVYCFVKQGFGVG